MSQRIALIAALRDELAPTLTRLSGPGIVSRVLGVGRRRAVANLDALLGEQHFDHVIHLGVAGGLDPKLKTSEVLRIGRVINEHGDAIDLRDNTAPALLTLDRLAGSVEAKRELFARFNAAAVDMETFHVAQRLGERGIPMTAIRAISDPADSALPAEALRWVRDDGTADTAAALRFLVRNPMYAPRLWKLSRVMRLATHKLADAVAQTVAELSG